MSGSGVSSREPRVYTLEAQIACVRRELALRKNVYPKWVKAHRMKAEVADWEIQSMQAVLDTLRAIHEPMFRLSEAARTDPEFPP